ncbi:MAG TPA: hypothetical protein DCP75_18665, partial [Haliea salexigens]|nr:hypothetical protein [Haliea salexigens]
PHIRIVMQLANSPAEKALSCDMPGRVRFIPLQQAAGEPYLAPAFEPYHDDDTACDKQLAPG